MFSMSDSETLDIVTTADQIVGNTTKNLAHQAGHPHRVVVAYIFDSNNDLHLQLVGARRRYDHSVGGHVRQGESYESAIRREMDEELGMETTLKLYGKLYSDESDQTTRQVHLYAVFIGKAPERWKFSPNNEVRAVKSLKWEHIRRLVREHPERFTRGFRSTFAVIGNTDVKTLLRP